jgi:Tfp pilus assembly protein PilF
LIARGNAMVRQGRIENQAQAAGLFQEAIDLAPDNADAWGGLGLADAFVAHNGSQAAFQAQNMRAQSAIARALALDPGNPTAWEAKAVTYPGRAAWFEAEQALRQGLKFHPDDGNLLLNLGNCLVVVGRMREGAAIMRHLIASLSGHIDPAIGWISIVAFAGAGEWVEADQAAARGAAQFPRHPMTWIHRVYLLMFTARPAEALLMLRDVDTRPPEQREDDLDGVIAVAVALQSGARADINKAAAIQLARAKAGGRNRDAENAFMFLSALGRLDDAFAVARACYLGPGANDPPARFAPNLFLPGCRAMRKDARFAGLMEQMGLADYWRKIGAKPDYQVYGDG